MNEMQVSERKVLRGDVVEKLYKNYGKDLRIAVLKNFLRIGGFVTEDELQKAIFILAVKRSVISMWRLIRKTGWIP